MPTAAMLSPEHGPNGALGITHENPSESWTSPADLDGALIRRTYAHFDIVGVPGDGVEDGIELTRERTHPLPFSWCDDRRSPSRASNTRPAAAAAAAVAAAAAAASASRAPLQPVPSSTSVVSNEPNQRSGFKPKSLVLSPHKSCISIGNGLPSPSAQSHTTSGSDYMSVAEDGGNASPPQQPPQSSLPHVNIVPATPILDAPRLPQSVSPTPPTTDTSPALSNGRFNQSNGGTPKETPSESVPPTPTSTVFFPQVRGSQRRPSNEAGEKLLEERLRNTDRYGFFSNSLSTSSHAKAVVLPKGSQIPDPVQIALRRREQEHASRRRERVRIDKWARMLRVAARDKGGNAVLHTFRDKAGISSTSGTGKSKKLRRRCYKGIPDRWRSAAWLALLERKASGSDEGTQGWHAGKQPAFSDLVERYDRLLSQPSQYDVQIDLDVPRTMSGHVLFHTRYGQGQRALFHVLHAFSLHCPDCGYCQGMGPIAASLLCYFEPSRAYAAMVRLHDAHRLHTIFAPGFPGLVENFYVQEQLIKWLFPSLHTMLEEHYIDASSYATKWYITLFANSVPFETQLRMWDIIFLDGQDALVGIALGVLWGIQNRLSLGDDVTFDTEPYQDISVIEEEESAAHLADGSHVLSDGHGTTQNGEAAHSKASSSNSEGRRKGSHSSKSKERRIRKRPSSMSQRLRPSKANGDHGALNGGGSGNAEKHAPSFEAVLGALTSYIIPASDASFLQWVSDLMARADVRARMKAARVEWADKQAK